MNRTDTLSTGTLNRLHDQAHDEAQALRQQALEDFWRGADRMVDRAGQGLGRAARRLAGSLRRHRALRGHEGAGCEA